MGTPNSPTPIRVLLGFAAATAYWPTKFGCHRDAHCNRTIVCQDAHCNIINLVSSYDMTRHSCRPSHSRLAHSGTHSFESLHHELQKLLWQHEFTQCAKTTTSLYFRLLQCTLAFRLRSRVIMTGRNQMEVYLSIWRRPMVCIRRVYTRHAPAGEILKWY